MLNVPIRLTRTTFSKSPSGVGAPSLPTMRTGVPMPAQLTRMRAAPCAASALATAAAAEASLGDVADDRDAADRLCDVFGRGRVEVGDRDLRALGRQRLGRRPPEPRAAARHDRRRTGNSHPALLRESCLRCLCQ